MTRVFAISDKFIIEGKGIAFVGVPFPETVNCGLSEGTPVEIRSGSAVVVKADIAGFELMRNTWSPHKPRGMAILLKTEDFELPEGAEVWTEKSNIHQPTQ